MSRMRIPLQPAELVELEGRDAVAFAHAQFTTDVRALRVHGWQWSALLDAQGRALAFFLLARLADERLLSWLPIGDAHTFRDALARFVFRSRVTITVREDAWLHRDDDATPPAPWTTREHEGGIAVALTGASTRVAWIGPAVDATSGDTDTLVAWRRADIDDRLPLLPASLAGKFVPQALELQRIGEIRFDQGCYPGQEIAARLHFRGGNKRSLRRLRIRGTKAASGESLLDRDGTQVGTILHAAPDGNDSLALAVVADAAIGTLAVTGSGAPATWADDAGAATGS